MPRKLRPRDHEKDTELRLSETGHSSRQAGPSERSVEKNPEPASQAQFIRALENSHQANQDLQLVAAAAGVDWRKLLMCIVGEIGWLGLARCLRSGSNFMECVTSNVDFTALLSCAGGSVTGGGFDAQVTHSESSNKQEGKF